MSNDRVKIILESWQRPDPQVNNKMMTAYRVKKLINTTKYHVGQEIPEAEVSDMIEVLRINVEIVERIFG